MLCLIICLLVLAPQVSLAASFPSFLEVAESREVNLYSSVTINCTIEEGQFLYWMHNNALNITDSTPGYILTGTLLTIANFTYEYSGEYRCAAGSIMSSEADETTIALSRITIITTFTQREFLHNEPEDYTSYLIDTRIGTSETTVKGRELAPFQCNLSRPIYRAVRPFLSWEVEEPNGNVYEITKSGDKDYNFRIQFDNIAFLQMHFIEDYQNLTRVRCIATNPNEPSEKIYSRWATLSISDDDFVEPDNYDPLIQKPLPQTYDENLNEGVVVPCAKSSGNLSVTLGWRISGDVNRYYQGSLDPARPDADFVGYNNMWLNLTNGNLLGHVVSCFTFIGNRVFLARTMIVTRPNITLTNNEISYSIPALLDSSISLNIDDGALAQWWMNGSSLVSGGQFSIFENGTLYISDITFSSGGIYQVDTINNFEISLITYHVQVVVGGYVTGITDDLTASVGSNVTLTCEASSIPESITYSWRLNGVTLSDGGKYSGTNTSTLSIASISEREVGEYECYPTNEYGNRNTSSTKLSVIGSLEINGIDSQNISNFAPPVSSGYTISPNNSRIILTDSGDLITDPLSPQDTGTYTFTSTDHGGATLTITVNVYAPAYVISISDPQTVSSGSSVTINVTVGGTPDDFTYQWFRNGILIAGETDSTLTIPSISTTDIGIYTCTPNNSRGSTNSSSTIISVTSSLSINGVGMQNISNFAPPVSSGYTISPNNSRIILTDSGDLITDPLSPQDTGTYTFTSADHGGATLAITVDVYAPAYVISISDPQTVSSGSSVTINVTVGGTPDDFTYQWFRNGILIAGETDSTLTIPSISTTDIGIYTCTPNNSRGSTNSSSTIISVTSSLTLFGMRSQLISNFAPPVSSGYTISPKNSRIILTESGDLITDPLSPQDTGTYTFTSADHGGATLTISITVIGSTIEISVGERVVIPCHTFDASEFRWLKDGAVIPGENGSSLVLSNVSYVNIGRYQCIAVDDDGNSTSSPSFQINVNDSKTLVWLTPLRELVFPPASEAYNCTPSAPFNVTSTGHLVTTGLSMHHSRNYSCYNKDINGTLILELIVEGLPPLVPEIQIVKFSSRDSQYIYVEWNNVATPLRPVSSYTFNWRVTFKSGTVDKRQLNAEFNTISTTNNYHYVSFRRGEIFAFTVSAANEAGSSSPSQEKIFDVDGELGTPGGTERQESLHAWIIALIVILVLICCICCLCCLICLCCLWGRRRKRDYNAEEQEKRHATELEEYRKKGEEEGEDESDEESSQSEGSIKDPEDEPEEGEQEGPAPDQNSNSE
uniref:Uncharacterized protein n=1 Tax=Amphimedon queenslandica TaxID=400682 RepID=A0A1X7UJA3_AMPQE